MRSIYAVACSAMVMLSAFTACDNSNDSFEYSPEQLAYFEKNREYIREKKKEKDTQGGTFVNYVHYHFTASVLVQCCE